MPRRLLLFILLPAAVVALGIFFLPAGRPKPAPAPATAEGRAGASSPTPVPSPPGPTAASPSPAPATPRRSAAPSTAPPAPAPVEPPSPDADAATLQIDADVPDAQVFVDRVFVGTTPLTTTDVKAGSHRLNVSAAGYEGIAQPLEVKPGTQQVTVKLREVRLSARIDVVHKHRIGSCRGTLEATPRAVTYNTSNKDDGFTVALTDLDEFQVDYLEKNLRLKLRQGKRYDFSDPEGNADRLFVFHRDVTQARERLAKGDPPASQ